MNKSELIEMMRHQADSLRIMAAAMMDYSTEEGDEWHFHGVELHGAAGHIESWVDEIEK